MASVKYWVFLGRFGAFWADNQGPMRGWAISSWQGSVGGQKRDSYNPASIQKHHLRKARNAMADYAHPEVLVTTGWVAEHTNDPKVKIVEVDVDTTSYEKGH